MKNLNQALKEDYSEKMNSLKFSDKRKLYNLYEEPKHTPVLRKVVALNVALACLILAFSVSATAVGFTTLNEVVANKTKDLNITDEKRDEMASRLESWGIVADAPENQTDFDIETNEYGDTLGSLEIGTDLIAVAGETLDGEEVVGYCYTDDFMEASGLFVTDSEQHEQDVKNGKVRNWIYVYDVDGITVIGKMVNLEFKTNEQLEAPDSNIVIIDGEDVKEYEAMAQERIEEKTAK